MIELFIGATIFALCLIILIKDVKFFLYVLLALSVLLHKEIFSLYVWDLLPVRFAMMAVVAYVLIRLINHSLALVRTGDVRQIYSKYSSDPFVVTLVLLWIVRGVSIYFSADMRSSLELFTFFTSIVIVGLFIYIRLKQSKEASLNYIKFYILVGLTLALVGYLQVFVNYKYGVTFGALWTIPGHMPRVGSLFWDVNHFGGFLASLLPLIGVLMAVSPAIKSKLFYALCLVPYISILFLTNSRTSWMFVAASLSVFCFLLLIKKFALKGTFIALSAFILISGTSAYMYSLGHSGFRNIVRTYINYRIDSFDAHFLLLQGTADVFSMYPVLGGGYGSFFTQFKKTEIASEYLRRDPAGLITKVPAHSIWGEAAAETGAVGFGVWLFLAVILIAVPLFNFLRRASYRDYFIDGAIVSSMVGFFTAGIFYSYNSEFFWFVLILYFSYSVAVLTRDLNTNFDFSVLRKGLQLIEHKLNAGFIMLIMLAIALIFINLGKNSLITWDESIYALISKNIVNSKEFMTLYWDKIWFEKPPLYFWVTAAFMDIFGIAEFSARLLSALSGLGMVIITIVFTRKIYGKNSAYLAGFILLTTTQFLYYARTSMLDVTSSFFITAALALYYLSPRRVIHLALVGILIGLAGMTKGIIFVLPLAVILSYEAIRGLLIEKNIKTTVATLLKVFLTTAFFALLVILPWHLYMINAHGKAFINSYFFYHILERASTSIEDKGKPFLWYLVVLKVSMRLWFLLLIPSMLFAITAVVKKDLLAKINIYLSSKEVDGLLFILLWALIPFFFFSISVSKLIWYIMPLYAPLAIICGVSFVFLIRRCFAFRKLAAFQDLFYLSSFALIVLGLAYFYTQKSLVYTGDFNASQKEILLAANKLYPDKLIWIDRLDHPVVLYYREGPFHKSEFKPIKGKLYIVRSGEPFHFITNQRRFTELQLLFPTLKVDAVAGDFVLASYSLL